MCVQLRLPPLPVYRGNPASLQLCCASSVSLIAALLSAICGGDPGVSFTGDSRGMVHVLGSIVQLGMPDSNNQQYANIGSNEGLREIYATHLWQPAADFRNSFKSG